ncbi:MAG: HEAT repeat domain-containing protein [Myxococcota bacterium]|nr:HEAT repeat domain-containing protein [Myxococcota bacterium]
MRNLRRCVFAIIVLAGCSGGTASNSKPEGSGKASDPAGSGKDATAMTTPDSTAGTTTGTTLERLQAWAGADLGINPWHDVQVPGVELFYAANTVEYRGVVVVDGTADPLTGKEALRAVRSRGVTDAAALAKVALLLLARGEQPILDPGTATMDLPAVRKLVRAPAIEGTTLTMWSTDQRGSLLVRHRVDLTTLELTSQPGQALVTAQRDPIDVALEQLAGKSTSLYDGAIDALVAACQDPRAAKALADVVARHPNAQARGWAAFQSATCHDAGTVRVLIAALTKDPEATVRKHAAASLGKLGAKEARGALDQAAQQDADLDVKGAAGRALKQLP